MARASRKKSGKRPYDNRLREEQARATRERVLEGLAELLRETDLHDLSVPAVAERTGVSVPTIYRHFPNRDALLDGLDAFLGEKLGRPRVPESVSDLETGAPLLFRYYEANYDELRTAKTTEAMRHAHAHAQGHRDRLMEQLLAPVTDHLEPPRAQAVHALFRGIFGFDTYERMRERFGVDAERASEVAGWATRALVAQLEAERAGRDENDDGAPQRPGMGDEG